MGRGRAAWSGASRRPNHECPCHATPPGSLPKHARRATRSGTTALTRPTGATASSTAWARALAWATPKCWHCRRMMHARRVIKDRNRPAVDGKRERVWLTAALPRPAQPQPTVRSSHAPHFATASRRGPWCGMPTRPLGRPSTTVMPHTGWNTEYRRVGTCRSPVLAPFGYRLQVASRRRTRVRGSS